MIGRDPARENEAAEAAGGRAIQAPAERADCDAAGGRAPRDPYAEFVEASPQGILFCHRWWLDAVAPGRWEILTVMNGSEIEAAWPIVWADEMRSGRIVMPMLTQKLGVLLPPKRPGEKYAERLSREHRLIGKLIEQLPEGAAVSQNFHENFTNWLPFYWAKFSQTTRYTYLIENLKDMESVWAELRPSHRSAIRKATKRGIRIRETDDCELFYSINAMTFARQGLEVPYSLDLVSRIDEACRRHAGRLILVAEGNNGHPHAAAYLVYDKRCAIRLMSGGDPEYRGTGAGDLLSWEMIERASKLTERFDFEGSMLQAVEARNRGFGAKQTPYFHISGCASRPPRPRWRRVAARLLRRLADRID